MNLLTIKEVVLKLLSASELCRDDDNRLIVSVWAHHLGDEKVNCMSAVDLLNELSAGKLPSPESIRRVRQKLQDRYPEYRGIKYAERLAEQKKVVNDLDEIK